MQNHCVRFGKLDGFIRVYDGTRYLVLLGLENYNVIYNKIGYSVTHKSGIRYIFFP